MLGDAHSTPPAINAAGRPLPRTLAPPRPRLFHFVEKPRPFTLPLWLPRKPEPKPCSSPRTAAGRHGCRRPRPPRGDPSSALPRLQPTSGTASPRPKGPPKPAHRRPNPSERRRRGLPSPPPAALRGRRATGHPSPHRDHLQVRLEVLSISPQLFPRLLGRTSPENATQTSPLFCPVRQGPSLRRNRSPVASAQKEILFSFCFPKQ